MTQDKDPIEQQKEELRDASVDLAEEADKPKMNMTRLRRVLDKVNGAFIKLLSIWYRKR